MYCLPVTPLNVILLKGCFLRLLGSELRQLLCVQSYGGFTVHTRLPDVIVAQTGF